jgi:FixJ family two-component response regulator
MRWKQQRVIVSGRMGEARTILVVDDEAAITSALTVLFDQADYQML